jgi:hypothetical protein
MSFLARFHNLNHASKICRVVFHPGVQKAPSGRNERSLGGVVLLMGWGGFVFGVVGVVLLLGWGGFVVGGARWFFCWGWVVFLLACGSFFVGVHGAVFFTG